MVLLCAKLRRVEYQCGCALYQQKWNEHEGTKTYSILKLDLTCSCPGCAQRQSWTSVSNTNCQHVWHHRATILLDLDHLDHLGLLCNWIIGDLFTAPCCTHVALPYFPHIDYRLFGHWHLLLTLEFWVKLQGRNLKLYSAWACDPSSDLQLLLPRIWSDSLDFYGFLGGPVAWSELDAQRRLSGAEDSFVLFVYIECL